MMPPLITMPVFWWDYVRVLTSGLSIVCDVPTYTSWCMQTEACTVESVTNTTCLEQTPAGGEGGGGYTHACSLT